MANIKEVAKIAGVSAATVSRVLNNTANVTDEKRERVLSAILETGFKTSDETRQLVKKRHKTICVVIPAEKSAYLEELIMAINRAAFQKGYRILVATFDENVENELSNHKMLSRVKSDGIIITAVNERVMKAAQKCQVPMVVFEQQKDYEGIIGVVGADFYKAGKLAMEHLLQCGCKNIVYLEENCKCLNFESRLQGYTDICRKYGIKEQRVECGHQYEDGTNVVRKMLGKYPRVDGVIANNDTVALSLYKALKREGYSIPEDIQIIGCGNLSMSEQVYPEITTIAQPINEMGTMAVHLIVDYLDEQPFHKENIFDVSLVERQTTKRKEIKYEKTRNLE